jgi:hypothetical protein
MLRTKIYRFVKHVGSGAVQHLSTNLLRSPCIVRVLQQFPKDACREGVVVQDRLDRPEGTDSFTETHGAN